MIGESNPSIAKSLQPTSPADGVRMGFLLVFDATVEVRGKHPTKTRHNAVQQAVCEPVVGGALFVVLQESLKTAMEMFNSICLQSAFGSSVGWAPDKP